MKPVKLQRREHPIFSPIGFLSTLLLIIGLSAAIFLKGGLVFSPGEVSAFSRGPDPVGNFTSHAEFGGDCQRCHTPWQGVKVENCESCHEGITLQRQNEGLHSKFEQATDCAYCHFEHKGADFNLILSAIPFFDHDITNFSLVNHELDYQKMRLKCEHCHQKDDFTPALTVTTCTQCHQTADADFMALHTDTYGTECLNCHDGLDTMAGFSLEAHAEVFPLDGVHATTRCESCHVQGMFSGTPAMCVDCHAEPDMHAGLFTSDCASCHRPDGWQPAAMDGVTFDHHQLSGFSLIGHQTNFDDSQFTCLTCHNQGQTMTFTDGRCSTCHANAQPDFMAEHIELFGENCMTCHDGTGEMANFDHNALWPLAGAHAQLQCNACHINRHYIDTPTECAGCHVEPEIHAGQFGLECQACHTDQAWQPAQLTIHNFPLDHGDEGEIACDVCHTNTYVDYTCYNCHAHDPVKTERKHQEEGIGMPELLDCVVCHPNGSEEFEGEDD